MTAWRNQSMALPRCDGRNHLRQEIDVTALQPFEVIVLDAVGEK
jgi:hypothetical protein